MLIAITPTKIAFLAEFHKEKDELLEARNKTSIFLIWKTTNCAD